MSLVVRCWLFVLVSGLAGCSTINLSGAMVLELGQGDVTESFEFEALDPREWTLTVNVTAPVGSVVEVSFLTSDGATLHIFETPIVTANADCEEEPQGYLDCVRHFPVLEAREPGTWRASVHKLSEPPADVHVNIAWDNVADST